MPDSRQLSKNREAAYGEERPHIVPLGFISPFQIIRDPADANVDTITLYESDGSITDITASMLSTGFDVLDFTTYKIWVYPGIIKLPISGLEEGVTGMTITDGLGEVLWREDFCWMDEGSMTGFVKVEWFHQRRLPLPFGHIEFDPPFKFWHWFRTELGRPSYQYERAVDERNGVQYVNKIVSWKQQLFVTRGDENFVDALSVLPHMDCVNVFFLGDEINVFHILVTPEWEDRGDEAAIEVEIRSNQVIVTNGDALAAKDYSVVGDCISVDFVALSNILENSVEYDGGYYINSMGDVVLLGLGDLILIESDSDGLFRLYEHKGGLYTQIILAVGNVVYDSDNNEYYVQNATYEVSLPRITTLDVSPDKATGFAFSSSIVEIWGKNGAVEAFLEVGTDVDFAAGIVFDGTGYVNFQARVSTFRCSDFSRSEWTGLGGIGVMEIENDFIVD